MYTNEAEMVKLFGMREMVEISNQSDASQTDINSERVTAAIKWAESVIDSYLCQRYTLPLPENQIPVCLSSYAADMARYKLDRETKFREAVLGDYQEALSWLKEVAAGKLGLGINTVQEETSPSPTVEFSATESVFSQEALSGF